MAESKSGMHKSTPEAAAADQAVAVGRAGPELELSDEAGRTIRLADLRGRKAVLYFYPKDDTPGCTAESCGFRDASSELAKRGAVVYGISADSVASHQKFKRKFGLTFPLLSDPDKRVCRAYGVWKQKSMYGRTYEGIERTTFVLDERGRIARIFPKVKVAGHIDEVLAAL